jgi:hypothetical protein
VWISVAAAGAGTSSGWYCLALLVHGVEMPFDLPRDLQQQQHISMRRSNNPPPTAAPMIRYFLDLVQKFVALESVPEPLPMRICWLDVVSVPFRRTWTNSECSTDVSFDVERSWMKGFVVVVWLGTKFP